MDLLLLLTLPLAVVLGLASLYAALRRIRSGRPPVTWVAVLALAAFALLLARARHLGPCTDHRIEPPTTAVDSLLDRITPGLRLPTRVCDTEVLLPGTSTNGYGEYMLGHFEGFLGLIEGVASTRVEDASSDDGLPARPKGLLATFVFSGAGPLAPLEDSLQSRFGTPTRAQCLMAGTFGTTHTTIWELPEATIILAGPPDPNDRVESLGRLPPGNRLTLFVTRGRPPAAPQGLVVPCEAKRPA